MKHINFLKIVFLLAVLITFSNFMANSQTYLSGASTNGCTAGTTGANSTFIGCGAGRVNTVPRNTFLGDQAGYNNVLYSDNVGVGYQVLFTQGSGAAQSPAYNVAVGNGALYTNNGGINNTAMGHNALYYNTTAIDNTAVGSLSGYFNTTGAYNTFTGYKSGYTNTTGQDNTFSGYQSGKVNTASYNTFSGSNSGVANTSGAYNTFSGYQSGYTNTTGTDNTFSGYQSGNVNTASYNTFAGSLSGVANTTGEKNTFSGYQSGYSNTTGAYNTFSGYQSGNANTVSSNNTFNGYLAGFSNAGNFNTFIGDRAGYSNTNGTTNTFVGSQCGYSNVSGAYNAFFGNQSGHVNTGSRNTFSGNSSAPANTSGGYNTASGMRVLLGNTTGSYNAAFGYQAGGSNTTGSNNTFLGYNANAGANNLSNVTAIGNGATAPDLGFGGNYVRIGNSSVHDTWVQVDWTIGSDRRIKNNIQENVPGLDFIKLLKPVTFHYDIHMQNSLEGYPTLKDSVGNVIGIDTTYWQGKYDIEQKQFTGLIAQQVDSAAQQIGYDFSGVSKNGPVMGLRYSQFTIPLIKAVQEQQSMIDSLRTAISALTGSNKSMLIPNSGESNDSKGNRQFIKLELPDAATLGNAQPNPNDGNTQIPYYLPENIIGAKIIFTDMLGKVMEEKPLETGYGLLNIDMQNVPNGTYSYSLVIDGKIIDNKKMIRKK